MRRNKLPRSSKVKPKKRSKSKRRESSSTDTTSTDDTAVMDSGEQYVVPENKIYSSEVETDSDDGAYADKSNSADAGTRNPSTVSPKRKKKKRKKRRWRNSFTEITYQDDEEMLFPKEKKRESLVQFEEANEKFDRSLQYSEQMSEKHRTKRLHNNKVRPMEESIQPDTVNYHDEPRPGPSSASFGKKKLSVPSFSLPVAAQISRLEVESPIPGQFISCECPDTPQLKATVDEVKQTDTIIIPRISTKRGPNQDLLSIPQDETVNIPKSPAQRGRGIMGMGLASPAIPDFKPQTSNQEVKIEITPPDEPEIIYITPPKGTESSRLSAVQSWTRAYSKVSDELKSDQSIRIDPVVSRKRISFFSDSSEAIAKSSETEIPIKTSKSSGAKANWVRAFSKVSESIKAEKSFQSKLDASLENKSSSSSESIQKPVVPTPKGKVRKKRGFFSKVMKYFAEEEDSDEAEQERLREKRQLELAEKESRKQLKKHRRQLLERKKKYTPQRSEVDITRSKSEIDFPGVNEKLRQRSRALTLGLGNAPSTFEEFNEKASRSLPSKKEAGKLNVIGSLVPLLLNKNKNNDTENNDAKERAAFLLQKFRTARKSSRRQSELITLRNLPGNLHDKLNLKHDLDKMRSSEEDKITKYQWIGQSIGQQYLKLRKRVRVAWKTVDIWNYHIHHIDGIYGVSAAVYFRWIRTILKLSICYLILTLAFIVFPGGLLGIRGESEDFTIRALFLAEGVVGRSKLFYGAYAFEAVTQGDALDSPGFRFLLVLFLIFVLNSVFIAARIKGNFATLATTRRQTTSRFAGMDYFTTVLTAWDFNVHQKEAAMAQNRAVARDLNLLLDKYYHKSTFVKPTGTGVLYTWSAKWGKHGAEILFWLTNILCLLYAIGIFFLLEFILEKRGEARIRKEEHELSVGISIGTALCISLFTNVFTPLVIWASNQEAWSSQATRIWTVHGRVGLLYVGIFAAFYETLVKQSQEAVKENNCWEEEVGNELFRIVIFDSIGNLVMTSFLYMFIPWVQQTFAKPGYIISKIQFDIESGLFELVFVLTLTGVGIPFFPVMPLITVIRLIFVFYYKKYLLFKYCAFSDQPLHLNDLIAPNLSIFFMSYLLICMSHIWMVAELHPSKICGAFGPYYNSSYSSIFEDVFTPNTYESFRFFGQSWFAFFTIFLLVGLVYTLRAWANATKASVSNLEELLHLERLDRKFLLKAMFNLAQVKKKQKARREAGIEDESQFSISDDLNLEEATQEALKATGRNIEYKRRNTLVGMFLRDSELQHLQNLTPKSQSIDKGRKNIAESDHQIIPLDTSDDEEVKPRARLQPGHFDLKKDELAGLQRQNMSKAAAIFLETSSVLRRTEINSALYDQAKKEQAKPKDIQKSKSREKLL